ncbi:MAG TPA: phage shock protein operon transcriptional activator [Acetobacteraceae bacterium]|nr:phage shock protein operon transcriptional activator [Acetobacteraceae bacterium]
MAILTTPPTPIGQSRAFLEMLAHVSRLAPIDRPVLIVGERGTGKELIASRLNYLSSRWDRSFVKLNCAALPEALLDSELFGHEAGAFTGAVRRRAGRFELADGGTLLLDEIATASLAVQEKILRVIEYGTFERVGGNDTLAVDVRVIAATNADLPGLAAAGKFRADLLDRLAFDVVLLPALRSRSDDIPLLAEHFATRMTAELKRPYFAGFAPTAMAGLLAHDWPGNVRELRNAVERSVCRMQQTDQPMDDLVIDPFGSVQTGVSAEPLRAGVLPECPLPLREGAGRAVPPNFHAAVRAHEADLLRTAMANAQFNRKQAARALGLTYDQLRHLLKTHGIRRNPTP